LTRFARKAAGYSSSFGTSVESRIRAIILTVRFPYQLPQSVPRERALAAGFKRLPYEAPRALEIDEIPLVVDEYDRAAARAMLAGFDGVELHGANGYLIDQFMQNGTNHRSDRYGGNVENRLRLLLEVTDALIRRVGASRFGVRLSPFSAVNDISDSDPLALFRYAMDALSSRHIAYLHLTEPRVNAGLREEPNLNVPSSVAAMFRESFQGPLIASGGFTKASADAAIRAGTADAIAFGRAFIANPDLPHRLATGAPLKAYDRPSFYGGTEKGYTDYPFLEPQRGAAQELVSPVQLLSSGELSSIGYQVILVGVGPSIGSNKVSSAALLRQTSLPTFPIHKRCNPSDRCIANMRKGLPAKAKL
jgi:2,4-dienoyl-CoA reductase-like NADH-dependent reductase (Old Yellow Enzyme family)